MNFDFGAFLDSSLAAANKVTATVLGISTSINNAQIARADIAAAKAERAAQLAILKSQAAAQAAAANAPLSVQATVGFFERNQTAILVLGFGLLGFGLFMRKGA